MVFPVSSGADVVMTSKRCPIVRSLVTEQPAELVEAAGALVGWRVMAVEPAPE